MEGRQELFTEGKRKGRVGEKKENVRGKTREMGCEILGRGGSIKCKEKEDDCETEIEMSARGDSRVSSSLLMAKEQRGSY